MRRSYPWLAGCVLVASIGTTWLSRSPRREAPAPQSHAAAPVTALELEVRDGGLSPPACAVPKGSRVRLRVVNRGSATARLSLAGYEDRFAAVHLAPGAAWAGEFLAELPGEDFAWILDGQPAGTLRVTGSHLVEGHR